MRNITKGVPKHTRNVIYEHLMNNFMDYIKPVKDLAQQADDEIFFALAIGKGNKSTKYPSL